MTARSGTTIPHAVRQERGRRVELYLPHALAALVDRVRGDVPLATWIREVLVRAVRRHRTE